MSLHEDIRAIRRHDPSVTSDIQVVLIYTGLHAVWMHSLSHMLWIGHCHLLAQIVSKTSRILTGVEIHPAARIGKRVIIDHGMGVVIGETVIIGNDVTIYQGVTLGGVSNGSGPRHPILGNHVLVGAGAKILGRVTIGDYARIGANAVVLRDVPPYSTAVGVPARIISRTRNPANDARESS